MTTYRLLIRLGAAALIFIIAVVGYGVWYAMVEGQSAAATDLANQIAQKRTDTSRAAIAKTQLTSLAADQATINQYFVSTDGVVPFLEGLQQTGTYFGANLQVVSVSAVPGKPYGHLDLSIKIVGPFNAVMRTIGAIEYEPYNTAIKGVTFNTDQQASTATTPTWTATMTVSVGTETGQQGSSPASAPVTSSVPSTTPTTAPAQTTPSTTPIQPRATSTPTAV